MAITEKERIRRQTERDIPHAYTTVRRYYNGGACSVLRFSEMIGNAEWTMKEMYYTRKGGGVVCRVVIYMREKYHASPVVLDVPEEDTDTETFCEDWDEDWNECLSLRRDRDEWDDFWDDRARDCGAVRF